MVSSTDVDAFRLDGYRHVGELITTAEAAELRGAVHEVLGRVAAAHPTEATWTTADAGRATVLAHCHDLHLHDARFTRLLLDPRVTNAAVSFLGTPDVQLHHTKAFVKPAGNGSPFPMHQDWPFFPHADDSPVAMILHLDDAPREKGCLQVVPGSHRGGRLPHVGTRDWYLDDKQFAASAVDVPARAGDAVFFCCLTVHGSRLNVSSEPRTTLLVQFRAASDRPTVDRHRSPGRGMMLSGTNASSPPPPTSWSS